jgi:hypothetical protein
LPGGRRLPSGSPQRCAKTAFWKGVSSGAGRPALSESIEVEDTRFSAKAVEPGAN